MVDLEAGINEREINQEKKNTSNDMEDDWNI